MSDPLQDDISQYRELDMHLRSSQGEANLIAMGATLASWAFIMVAASRSSHVMTVMLWFIGTSIAVLPVMVFVLGLIAILYQRCALGKKRLAIADRIARALAREVSDGSIVVTEEDISPLIHHFSRQSAGDDVQIQLEGSYLVARVNGYERAKTQVRALLPPEPEPEVIESPMTAPSLRLSATS